MLQETITKRLTSNQQSLMLAKFRNFKRKSILRHLLASFLLAFAFPNFLGGFVFSLLGIFSLLCILSFVTIYYSSKIQSKQTQFDANVTFEKNNITLKHLEHGHIETKEWSWIIKAQENKYGYFLTIQKHPLIEIILPKNKLSDEESVFFKSMLIERALIK